MIECLGMLVRIGLGFEGGAHHLLEHGDGQERPPLGQRPVRNDLAGQLLHMLGQCASLGHDMEDQALNQFHRRDHRWTAATNATAAQQGVNEGPGEQLFEQSLERGDRDGDFVSHPEGNAQLSIFVQGKNCLPPSFFSPLHTSDLSVEFLYGIGSRS